jgi:hypothetical protein
VAEEPTELFSFKSKRPHGALCNYSRHGRSVGQECDLTDEAAWFQVRDLTTSDRDSDTARANEENFFERPILLG